MVCVGERNVFRKMAFLMYGPGRLEVLVMNDSSHCPLLYTQLLTSELSLSINAHLAACIVSYIISSPDDAGVMEDGKMAFIICRQHLKFSC